MFQQLVNLIWFCDASFSVPSSKRLRMCFSSCVLVQSSQKKLRGIEISFKSKSSHNLRWTPWTNGWCYVCYVMLLCLKCFFVLPLKNLLKHVPSIDFHNRFSMDLRCSIPTRLLPVDSLPDSCHRMPQVAWWLDGQLDRPPPISRTARPCHPNNPNPCSRPPDENRTRTGWLWSCEFLISSVTFSVFAPLLLL